MDDPGPSTGEPDAAVTEVINSVVSEVAHNDAVVPLDSPSFSSSSCSLETAGSSENVTDHEQEIIGPVKKRKGRPPKNKQHEVPSSPPKTAKKRAPAKKRKSSDDEMGKSPKKKSRPPKAPALRLTSNRDNAGGCLSQKMCKRPRRRSDTPDPFDDDDEEFERVTSRMTLPRKRAIEFLHNGVIASTSAPPSHVEKELALVPFSLITKFHKDIEDAGEVVDFPNDSIVFT